MSHVLSSERQSCDDAAKTDTSFCHLPNIKKLKLQYLPVKYQNSTKNNKKMHKEKIVDVLIQKGFTKIEMGSNNHLRVGQQVLR